MQDKEFVEKLELGIMASNIYRWMLPLGFTRIFKEFIPLDCTWSLANHSLIWCALVGAAVPEMSAETYAQNQAQLLTEKFANAAHYELRSFNQVSHVV